MGVGACREGGKGCNSGSSAVCTFPPVPLGVRVVFVGPFGWYGAGDFHMCGGGAYGRGVSRKACLGHGEKSW